LAFIFIFIFKSDEERFIFIVTFDTFILGFASENLESEEVLEGVAGQRGFLDATDAGGDQKDSKVYKSFGSDGTIVWYSQDAVANNFS